MPTDPLSPELAEIRQTLPAASRLTWLQIDPGETRVVTDSAGEGFVTHHLAFGVQQLGGQGFRQYPPTAYALEMAIAAVEDELMPLARQWQGHSTLVLTGPWAAQVLHLAGVPDPASAVCSREAVEALFGLLAAVVQGRPVTSSGLPAETDFAAYLLILREFMHHVGFDAFTLR